MEATAAAIAPTRSGRRLPPRAGTLAAGLSDCIAGETPAPRPSRAARDAAAQAASTGEPALRRSVGRLKRPTTRAPPLWPPAWAAGAHRCLPSPQPPCQQAGTSPATAPADGSDGRQRPSQPTRGGTAQAEPSASPSPAMGPRRRKTAAARPGSPCVSPAPRAASGAGETEPCRSTSRNPERQCGSSKSRGGSVAIAKQAPPLQRPPGGSQPPSSV